MAYNYQSTGGPNPNTGYMAHPQPYGGGMHQQQPQPYGGVMHHQPQPYGSGYQNDSEYMTQITPAYPATAPPSEYMRQPASNYSHAPMMPMPEPVRETIREQPQVIIVHHNDNDDDCCNNCIGWCCRCICESVATIIWTLALIVAVIIVIAVLVYFLKFYRKHH